MREILFRGKRIDNGEWVIGNYVKTIGNNHHPTLKGDRHDIYPLSINSGNHEVIPETVGQYTGLTDKNGNKIFEGDIDSRKRVVMWNDNLNLHCLHKENRGVYIMCYYPFSKRDALEVEITGNIWDNK